jgi:hypothetical protein
MKIPGLVALLVVLGLIPLAASTQTGTQSTEPAGLKIIKVELQHTVARGPSVRAVAATDPDSQTQARAARGQDANTDSIPALHRMSQDAEVAPKASKSDQLGNLPSNAPLIFIASIVVKNIGTKAVTAVQWEYLLFETGGAEPVKRYRIQSKKLIAPDEQVELTKEVTPKGREQQARLIRIEYADGSFWQQPPELDGPTRH